MSYAMEYAFYMIRDFINSDRFYNQAERVNKIIPPKRLRVNMCFIQSRLLRENIFEFKIICFDQVTDNLASLRF